jgi:hypothetical protein
MAAAIAQLGDFRAHKLLKHVDHCRWVLFSPGDGIRRYGTWSKVGGCFYSNDGWKHYLPRKQGPSGPCSLWNKVKGEPPAPAQFNDWFAGLYQEGAYSSDDLRLADDFERDATTGDDETSLT